MLPACCLLHLQKCFASLWNEETIMSDQRSQGGKKKGTEEDRGHTEQHQSTHESQGQDQTNQRPPKGEPGGPKPSAGKTRPQD